MRTKRRTSNLKLSHRQQCKNDHRMHQSEFRIALETAPWTKSTNDYKHLLVRFGPLFLPPFNFSYNYLFLNGLPVTQCYEKFSLYCVHVVLWCVSVRDLSVAREKVKSLICSLRFEKRPGVDLMGILVARVLCWLSCFWNLSIVLMVNWWVLIVVFI